MTIKILLVDESPIFRLGLKQALPEEGIEICGEAADGLSAQRLIRQQRPDIILLSADLSDVMPMTVCDFSSAHFPEIQIIFLVNPDNLILCKRLIRTSAQGFIGRTSVHALEEAIKTVQTGKTYLQSDLGLPLLRLQDKERFAKIQTLTDREYQALVLLARGKISEEVAEIMRLSVRTVFNLKSVGFKKLNIQTIEQLFDIIF